MADREAEKALRFSFCPSENSEYPIYPKLYNPYSSYNYSAIWMAEDEYTTIQVRKVAREELAKLASYGDSMADVVDRLVASYKKTERSKKSEVEKA